MYCKHFSMKLLKLKSSLVISLILVFIQITFLVRKYSVTSAHMKESVAKCVRYGGLGNRTSDPLYCTRMKALYSSTCDKNVYDLRIIAIVLNRSASLLRLLRSLNEAVYDGDRVKLEVWIDRSVNGHLDEATLKVANTFEFRHGAYEVKPHLENVGLLGQWLSTWTPARNSSEIGVICEDDITLSKYFYRYLKIVHKKYDDHPYINGYALQGSSIKHHENNTSLLSGTRGSLVYLYPVLGSWGFSPSNENWIRFQEWYISVCSNQTVDLYIPNSITNKWFGGSLRKGKSRSVWTIWHMFYAYINSEFTLYANLPGLLCKFLYNVSLFVKMNGKKDSYIIN